MVEVAAMVTTERESGVVVPIERLSVWVVRWTRVPESVQPERFWVEVPQMMFPEESVVRELEPEQDWTVAIFKPPAEILSPCRVFVALAFVWRILPPEMVRPFPEERPAVEIPPAKVEVAVEEELIAWSCVRPSTNKPPENNPFPPTESLCEGDVVPRPKLFEELITDVKAPDVS